MTGLELRVAVASDAAAISALMRASVEAIFPAVYDAAQTASAAVYIATLHFSLLEDGTYYVVESPDGALAACGGWSRRRKLFAGSGDRADDDRLLDPATEPARVRAMFVHPAWTRRGIGTRILVACEQAARAEGFTELALMATLPGVPLYRSWGFVGDEREPITLPDGVVLDGVAMRRRI